MPYREFFDKKASSDGLPFLSPLLTNWFGRELMGYYNFHPVCEICKWSLDARVQDKAYKLLNGQYLLPLTKASSKKGEAPKGKIRFPTAHNLCRVIEKNQRDFMVNNQNLDPNDPKLLQLREVGMKAMLLSILAEAKEHPEGRSLKLGDVLQRYIRIEEVQEGKVTNA